MPSQQAVQQSAVLILMMIAGADCYRITMNATTINAIRDTLQTIDSSTKETSSSVQNKTTGGGNKVCRNPEMRNAAAMEARWKAKADKMRALASVIKAKKGKTWKIMELRNRLKMWHSCIKIHNDLKAGKTSGTSNAPMAKLFGVDATDRYALRNVLMDVTTTLSEIKVTDEALDGCSLNTANINLLEAVEQGDAIVAEALPAGADPHHFQVVSAQATQAIDIVMKQLYGAGCTHHKMRAYQRQLGRDVSEPLWELERKIKEAVINWKSSDDLEDGEGGGVIERTLNGLDGIDGGSDGQVNDEILDNDALDEEETLAANGEDLLEAVEGSEVSLLEAGDGGATFGIILLIILIALIIFYLVCYFNGFSLSVSRNSWNAYGSSKNRCK